jgi:hypothetical protein
VSDGEKKLKRISDTFTRYCDSLTDEEAGGGPGVGRVCDVPNHEEDWPGGDIARAVKADCNSAPQ